MKKCSMQKKMESLGKKNERSVRHFTNRIESLAEQEFVDMAAIGEYMLTAFSEDQIEQAYDWMECDEMIPTEDDLEENGIEFSDTNTRKYTNRIIDLVDMEYLTYNEIGEYLLRAFSEDDIEKLYGWLKQDEMIPSEEELRDMYDLEFDYDGELVSAEKEESCKKNEDSTTFYKLNWYDAATDSTVDRESFYEESEQEVRKIADIYQKDLKPGVSIEIYKMTKDEHGYETGATLIGTLYAIGDESCKESVDKRSPAYFHDITRPVWQYFRNNPEMGITSGWHGNILCVFDKDMYENDGPWFARLSYDSDTDKVQVEFFDGSKKEYPSESVTTDELTGVLEDFLRTNAKEYLEYAGIPESKKVESKTLGSFGYDDVVANIKNRGWVEGEDYDMDILAAYLDELKGSTISLDDALDRFEDFPNY